MPRVKTHQEFVNEINEKYGNEYDVLGIYKNAQTKILVRHNICGESWDIAPMTLAKKNVCPFCSGNKKSNTSEFKTKVEKTHGKDYTVVGEYKNAFTDIKVRHEVCGNEFNIRPNNLLNGRKCPICSILEQTKAKSLEQRVFVERVFNLYGNEFDMIGQYVNTKTNVEVYHKKCMSKVFVRPDHFMNGNGCPNCNESSGEQMIRQYLEANGITFSKQFTFDELKRERKLKFDFAIFKDKDMKILLYLLEYDGEHHYEPVYGTDKLKEIQESDYLKNLFCEDNEIQLYRIPYWNKSCINEILNEINLGG